MNRRTLRYYAHHPRVFEEAVQDRDERLLDRYLAEQDAGMDRRENGWLMQSGPLASKQPSQEGISDE